VLQNLLDLYTYCK